MVIACVNLRLETHNAGFFKQEALRCAAPRMLWSSVYGRFGNESGANDAFATLIQVLQVTSQTHAALLEDLCSTCVRTHAVLAEHSCSTRVALV
jgi:hypothetical protein